MLYTKVTKDNNQGIVIPVKNVKFDDQYYYMLALSYKDNLATICIHIEPGNCVAIDDGDGCSYKIGEQMNQITMKKYHLTAMLDVEHEELVIVVPTVFECYLSDRIL